MPSQPVQIQYIAAKAVISGPDGKVLVLREAGTYDDGTNVGRYGLPGGRLELGEPFLEALRREVDEETGLTVEVGEPFFVGEWYPRIHAVQSQIVGIFFACTTTGREVRLSREHDRYLWIDPADYGDLDLMPPESDVLKAWLKRP